MKKTLIAAMAALALVTGTAEAKPLPQCNDDTVHNVFLEAVQPWEILELKDWRGADDKRWCYAFYIGRYGMRSPYMEAIYTLEWVDESEGRFWLQVRQFGRSCRGVMGNPWSEERCTN